MRTWLYPCPHPGQAARRAGGGLGRDCGLPSPPLLDLGPQVEFSLLNPNGPFVLLNPISKLPVGETHVLALSFCPHESMMVSPRPTLCCCSLGLHSPLSVLQACPLCTEA